MTRALCTLGLALSACGPALDERRPAGPERVEAYLRALTAASKVPGIQYLVVGPEGVRFEHAGGWADLGRRVPLDADTTMMAYSMSKTITAVAVLQLVEAGKLGLDEPVDRYLDGLPYGPGVTVRRLLSHTAGLPNPIPLRWVHPAARHQGFDERAALEAVLREHPQRSSEPGERYAYSNIGYWLLGRLVERASGQPFASYVSDHVLRPLGIEARAGGYEVVDPAHQATGYLERYSFMNLAKGFLLDRELIGDTTGRWVEIRAHLPDGPAFGGLVGTARGFGRFLQDQLRPRSVVLGDGVRGLLQTPQRTAQGKEVDMTLGWHVGELGGRRFLYKEGGGGGFHCMMRLYPERGLGTVVMTNATGFDVRGLLDAVDPDFLGPAASGPDAPRP